MKIQVEHTFRHGTELFQEGEIRFVEDSLGDYFYRAGWITDLTNNKERLIVDPRDTVLEIQNISSQENI